MAVPVRLTAVPVRLTAVPVHLTVVLVRLMIVPVRLTVMYPSIPSKTMLTYVIPLSDHLLPCHH